jgi:aminoglycoside phosphotransferase (APT) family kinase protein
MAFVDGRIFWDATIPDIARPERPAYFDAMNEAIARLHTLDPEALGLADFGKAGNYFRRQVSRWTDQYLGNEIAGRDPHMDRLIAWLPSHIPENDETAIVHGDFRIDNMIFHPSKPELLAVLDWELSTLGHPLADFSYHAMMYRMPPNIVAGLKGADIVALGIPPETDYIAAYCRRTGRNSIPNYEFYLAFNFFRLAAIFHGIKGRLLSGNATSADAAARAANFPVLAELAWDLAKSIG